jgi:hypothetical protein
MLRWLRGPKTMPYESEMAGVKRNIRAEDSAVSGRVLQGIAFEQQICGSPHKDFLMNKGQELLDKEF